MGLATFLDKSPNFTNFKIITDFPNGKNINNKMSRTSKTATNAAMIHGRPLNSKKVQISKKTHFFLICFIVNGSVGELSPFSRVTVPAMALKNRI